MRGIEQLGRQETRVEVLKDAVCNGWIRHAQRLKIGQGDGVRERDMRVKAQGT